MKLAFVAAAALLLALPRITYAQGAQGAQPISIDSAKAAFAQAKALYSADNGTLWGVSLCGPIMFVDAPSRAIVANEPDGKGALEAKEGAFAGVMPADRNVASTAAEWSGRKWTQMLWPLPHVERLRATLMMHELFHRIQNRLGLLTQRDGDNTHLDELNGRYYMQLEWRALARALAARGDAERREAGRDVLAFRAERYRLYPSAAAQERALEQNEGLAE